MIFLFLFLLQLLVLVLVLVLSLQRRALQDFKEPDRHVRQAQPGSMPRSRHPTRTMRHHEIG